MIYCGEADFLVYLAGGAVHVFRLNSGDEQGSPGGLVPAGHHGCRAAGAVSQRVRKLPGFRGHRGGGGATIQSAIDPNLGRRVALKTIRPDLADDPLLQRRFLREARVTAMIQHPATVPVYEIGRDREGRPYVAMKLVLGQSLHKIIDGLVGRLPPFEAFRPRDALVDIVIQTGQALAYAHKRGIVHRDVKPDNITVGDFGEVLVMDWGVAKVLGEPEPEADAEPLTDGPADLTLQGKVYGTPATCRPSRHAPPGTSMPAAISSVSARSCTKC